MALFSGLSSNTKDMGLGQIGTSNIIFKRKFRWTMKIQYCDKSTNHAIPEDFVKVGSRPQLDIEEQEINYLHGKMWIPGKATWQTMTVTYYDVAGKGASGSTITSLYSWIASVYDITNPTTLHMGNTLSSYEGEAQIYLYDGCGTALEGWWLKNVWPQSVNFGELDMSSSEECTVELTLRYSNVQYVSFCPESTPSPCPCSPCPT